MYFKLVSRIRDVEVIAAGTAIRDRKRLWKNYGKGRWRKLKGTAKVEFTDGTIVRRRFTGTKLMGSARKNTKSSGLASDSRTGVARFVLCVRNRDYPASLELSKVYRLLKDEQASRHHQMRVIDESGEDYLYPEEYFVPIKLPQAAEKAVLGAI